MLQITLEASAQLIASIKQHNSNFFLYPSQEKDKIFKTAISHNEQLSSSGLSFSQFLSQLAQAANDELLAKPKDTEIPFERFLRKFIEFQNFRIESKEIEGGAGATSCFSISLSYIRTSACLECLQFLVTLLKRSPETSELINRSTVNLGTTIVQSLKTMTEFERSYDATPIMNSLKVIKDALWNSLEEIICEKSLLSVLDAISKGTFVELFQLLDPKNGLTYSKQVKAILKRLSKVAKGSLLVGKVNEYLDENRCLLAVWKDLDYFRERQTLDEKFALLEFLDDVFLTVATFKAPYITYNTLNEIQSFLEADIMSTLASDEQETSEDLKYLKAALKQIATLSKYPLNLYTSEEDSSRENVVFINPFSQLSPEVLACIPAQNSETICYFVFYKMPFDILVRTVKDKKAFCWHSFLLEVNNTLLKALTEYSGNHVSIELTLQPLNFLLKTLHACDYRCIDSSLDLIGYLITKVAERNPEADVFAISSHLKTIQDVRVYIKVVEYINTLCKLDSKALNSFSGSIILFQDVIEKLVAYLTNSSDWQFPEAFVKTLCSLISVVLEEKRHFLDIVATSGLLQHLLETPKNQTSLRKILIPHAIELLTMDLKLKKSFSNIVIACLTLKESKTLPVDITIEILEALFTMGVQRERLCIKMLIKENGFLDAFIRLLKTTFSGIGREKSEFSRLWKALEEILDSFIFATLKFSEEMQGFRRLVEHASAYIETNRDQGQFVVLKLLGLSLCHPKQTKNSAINGLDKSDGYIIKYPRLFKEVYCNLVVKGIEGDNEDYFKLLTDQLSTQPFNYRVLNSCEFLEALYQAACAWDQSTYTMDSIFKLGIEFLSYAPCLSTLRLLNKYLKSPMERLSAPPENTGLSIQCNHPVKTHNEKTIIHTLEKKLSSHQRTTLEALSLSSRDPNLYWKYLWIPRLTFSSSNSKELTSKRSSVVDDSLTIFMHITLKDVYPDRAKGSCTLFRLSDNTGQLQLRAFISKEMLIVQSDEQETIADPIFLKTLSKLDPTLSKDFTLAVSISNSKSSGASQPSQVTPLSVYVNGFFVSLVHMRLAFLESKGLLDGQHQLVIGDAVENNTSITLDLMSFFIFRRSLNKEDIQDLHALTVGSVTPLTLIGHTVEIEFQRLEANALEALPLDMTYNKSLEFSSKVSYSERTVSKVAWAGLMKDVIAHYSPSIGIKRLKNCESFQNKLLTLLPGDAFMIQGDIQKVLNKESLAFVPNLASGDDLYSSGFLVGCQNEKSLKDLRAEVWDSPSRNLVRIMEESGIVETLMAKLLKYVEDNERSTMKDILKVLVLLFRKSSKIRKYLLENNLMSFVCGMLESSQHNDEQLEIYRICKGLFMEGIADGSGAQEKESRSHKVDREKENRYEEHKQEAGGRRKEKADEVRQHQHYILYCKNAFQMLFESFDVLASPNEKLKEYGFKLLEEYLLKEDNLFSTWNLQLLREVQLAQLLIEGLVIGRYADITEKIFALVYKLISHNRRQGIDLECVSRISEALDFLYFSSEDLQALRSLIRKLSREEFSAKLAETEDQTLNTEGLSIKPLERRKSVADAYSGVVRHLTTKYITFTSQNAGYGQQIYNQFLKILLSLLAETTVRKVNTELLTLLLNTLFCYGDKNTYIKAIQNLLEYVPRYWDPVKEDKDTESDKSDSPALQSSQSSRSIWNMLAGKNQQSSDNAQKQKEKARKKEAKIKKTKELEELLDSLIGYIKALILMSAQKVDFGDTEKACYFLNMVGLHEEIIFEDKGQENSFLSCMVYLLLPVLISDYHNKVKDKILAIFCCMICRSKETMKKILTYEKQTLYDKGFNALLKYQTNTSAISISNFTQLVNDKRSFIETLMNSKLYSEWNQFCEEVRKKFEMGPPTYIQFPTLVTKENPCYYHSLLFPKMYTTTSAQKPKQPLFSFFIKPVSTIFKLGTTVQNTTDPTQRLSELLQSVEPLKERFNKAYGSFIYQRKNRRLAQSEREIQLERFLRAYNRREFLTSLLNSTSSDPHSFDFLNYAWVMDNTNYPRGQRVKSILKEIAGDKSQYERICLKNRMSLDEAFFSPIDSVGKSQKKHFTFSIVRTAGTPKEREEESARELRSAASITSIDQDPVNEQQENYAPEIWQEVKFPLQTDPFEFEQDAFNYGKINQELGITETIVSKYNCLYINLQERAECVFLVTKCSLYICLNYQLDNDNKLVEVPFLNQQNIVRAKWVTLSKNKKANSDLESLDSSLSSSRKSSRSYTQSSEPERDAKEFTHKIIRIPLHMLAEVHARRYLLQPNAMEIYSQSGKSYLIAFTPTFRNIAFVEIVSAHAKFFNPTLSRVDVTIPKETLFFATLAVEPLPSKRKPVKSPNPSRLYIHSATSVAKQAQSFWVEGDISNYDYLNLLNLLAGRTYTDLSQYPVFPWVLSHYYDHALNYTKKKLFRKLGAPIGALTSDRIDSARKRYKETKESMEMTPYHFGSHYSSPGVVMYYLIRLFPFSKYAAHLQGGRFDFPDRLFSSLQSTFTLAQQVDYKELIPEFYSLPEFLININKFHFGTSQDGTLVNHVGIPPWASGDPRHFVQGMRRALESEYPSESLNGWIDLIFGSKQRDKKAEETINVYHELTYEGSVNLEASDIDIESMLAQIHEFGQCPKKIFDSTHPTRKKTARNMAIFGSKETLKNLTFNVLVEPKEGMKGRCGLIEEIRMREDTISDSLSRIGLTSFQQAITLHEDSPEDDVSVVQNLMFSSKGYMLRGDKPHHVINWNNIYKSLVLYSLEKEKNYMWVFNDQEFEHTTTAAVTREGDKIILGNRHGGISVFIFREETVEKVPEQEKKVKKKKSIFLGFSKAKKDPLQEDILQKVKKETNAERTINGWEVKEDLAKQKILLGLMDQEKYKIGDFGDKEEVKQPQKKSKEVSQKDEEYEALQRYSKFFRTIGEDSKDKVTKLVLSYSITEAHNAGVNVIKVSKLWNIMVTGDENGMCKVWDFEKNRLIKEVYTYHFKDHEVYTVCGSKIDHNQIFTGFLKKGVEREKIVGVSISEANGDFCLISDHYVSIYTINGVLVSVCSARESELPKITTALLTKNRQGYEENILVTGHEDGLISFWVFKQNEFWKSKKFSNDEPIRIENLDGVQIDDVVTGKFGHVYDKSIYVNKMVKLNDAVQVFTCKIQSSKKENKNIKVTSLMFSTDQTKLLAAISTGEIFCFKEKVEEIPFIQKSCSWCEAPIGLVDTRATCGICQKVCCVDCAKTEESVSSVSLWKKMSLCPKCAMSWNSKSIDTLYDFY